MVFHQLALYLGIYAPPARLVRPQVRKHELRSFLCIIPTVVFRYHPCAVARLVVRVVFIRRVYHAHVQCHLPCVVRGDEHLRLFLRFRQFPASQQRGVARLGKFHQPFYEMFLVGRGRYVMQYFVLVRTVHAHILCRAVVRYLVVERRQLRHLDEVAEAFLLHDVVRHIELEIRRLLGEDCRPCVKASYVLSFQLLRTQVLEKQVQLRQRVADGRARQERRPQILSRPLLDGADGKQQVQCLLTAFRVAQTRHTVMPCVERQVLELVRLVHEDMVDAHLPEVHHIVCPRLYSVFHLLQLGCQVELAFLQSLQHCTRHVLALRTQHFQIFLHCIQLRLQYPLLQFRRLRYLPELVVAHDDAVPVVIPYVVEEAHPAGCGKILFRGIQHSCVGVCRAVAFGYLPYIRLQPDNHRLVYQSQTLHLVRCHAHDQRLAGSHLVVGYSSAVLFQHPDAVLLAGVQVCDSQSFQVQFRKFLVRAVIFRSHETVELVVVHVRQPFLELRRLLFQPFRKSVSDFVNLRVRQLYALAVPHLYVVPVLVLADLLHHVGAGVVQGVFQQVHPVIVAVVPLHQKLVGDFHRPVAARNRILVKALRVAYPHVRVKQTAHVGGIHARGYPSFPEVEVQFLKRNLFRHGFLQHFQRLPCLRQHPVLPVSAYPFLHIGGLLYHVPGYEAVGYLVALCQRVVEHPSFQCFQHVRLRHVADGFHVGQVYSAIQVQRGGQGFLRRFRGDCRFLRKGNGAVEYVRLHHRAALAAFQCQHVAPGGIHHQQLHVLLGVQAAVTHHELVIVGVQVAAQHFVLLLLLRFVGIEPLVGVAQVYV